MVAVQCCFSVFPVMYLFVFFCGACCCSSIFFWEFKVGWNEMWLLRQTSFLCLFLFDFLHLSCYFASSIICWMIFSTVYTFRKSISWFSCNVLSCAFDASGFLFSQCPIASKWQQEAVLFYILVFLVASNIVYPFFLSSVTICLGIQEWYDVVLWPLFLLADSVCSQKNATNILYLLVSFREVYSTLQDWLQHRFNYYFTI